MFTKTHNYLPKILTILFTSTIGFTAVYAGDLVNGGGSGGGSGGGDIGNLLPADDAEILPENIVFEDSLLPDDDNYPDVGLRKQVSQDCYCDGGYFGLSGGYAFSNLGYLTKGSPIVANPSALNELIPTIAMRGRQYTASINAGYKFGALRAEASGEYRSHAAGSIAGATAGGTYTISSKTEQYAALMSIYYDVEIPNIPIMPYVGLGAGLAYTKTNYAVGFTKAAVTTNGNIRYTLGRSFAGTAMAGFTVQVAENFTLDLGYKFMGIVGGNANYAGADNAAAINAAAGTSIVNIAGFAGGESLVYPYFISHEVKLGARYRF
ncbi:MAG: outer membrane beta-barrel protein [Rhizobiales bacterium]|nr:outer membrane beta-barrel protein [Hyphomicrobiales bacterium]NRB14149.1 outer membrane beta-barrel protein [Hyphomicrobiales bacterium]